MRAVRTWYAAVIVAAGTALPSPARADSFADVFGTTPLKPIGGSLGQAVARSIPIIAASPGLVFDYDPESGAFVRRSAVVGQLFVDRAEPLGRGHWNLTVGYEYVAIDSIGGVELHNLRDVNPITVPHNEPLRIPRFRIDLETQQQVVSATYGVTDAVDVNVTIPVLESHLAVGGHFEGNPPFGVAKGHSGVGDIFLRGKYRLWTTDLGDIATTLALRLPSGSEADFQGTGTTEVSPGFALSSIPLRPAHWLELQAYMNGVVDLQTRDVGASQGRWGIGIDARLRGKVSLAIAFIARHAFQRIASPGAIDLPREHGGPAPLFGLDLGRPDTYQLSIGGRAVVWRDYVILFANVLIPLNEDGVQTELIPLVGVELAF